MFWSKSQSSKKVIVVKLKGGLGNQMFQYACGKAVSLKHNSLLYLDISGFPDHNGRKYSLEGLNVKANIADNCLLRKFKDGLLSVLLKKLGFNIDFRYKCYFEKKRIVFDPEIFDAGDNIYIDGYWQNEEYFKHIERILLEDFTLKNPLPEKEMPVKKRTKKESSVALHIRRGDYVTNPETKKNHGVLDICYYNEAMKIISSKVNNPHFFVFSDDIYWAENNLKSDFPIYFIKDHNYSNVEELYLMTLCDHHIIANSTFSWWGAWLSKNPQKIVIAPQKWFSCFEANIKGLIPDEWIKI